MKNTVRCILVLVMALPILSGSLLAQQTSGIHGGYIESDLTGGDDPYNLKYKYQSFYVGFTKDQKIIPLLHLNTGLDYYQTGSQYNENNKLVLHYISVPLGLKVKLGPFQVFGGVHGAVKVSSKLTLVAQPVTEEKFSTFDAGYFVGAGLRIIFIGAEAKYTWGLVDVNRGNKNNFFQAGLVLWF